MAHVTAVILTLPVAAQAGLIGALVAIPNQFYAIKPDGVLHHLGMLFIRSRSVRVK